VGHGLEADFNRNKTSRYSDRMGTIVASPLCTIVDDATLPGSRGSINVDDEGNAGRANVLIEAGRLVGYMHDQRTAEHFQCEPTGNGRRASYTSTPMPRMTSTLLMAGPHAPAEIVGSVRRGIYARKLGGGQVEIANGSFVFAITEGYLIEDGKITAPLRGANLVGNGAEVLRRVSMVGDDRLVSDGIWSCAKQGQHVPVWVGCPTVKIDAITVGGTKVG
jgi:TldD protein